ncbi:SUKH-4 family immunity protein [Streptomyces sp. NPDC055005]
MPDDDLDALFSCPSALLAAGPARVRERVAAAGGVGREVFTQAEAVFGRERVSRAEFASWLHFAAKVLGREAYAELTAAAEPGMPWRTVWAWWRPVGAHRAEPNLSGDWSVDVHDPVTDSAEGDGGEGPLLKVWSLWTGDRWFDLGTGTLRPAPAAGTYAERAGEPEDEGPALFDGDDDGRRLVCPGTWEEPVHLGGGRFLFAEARGLVVVERGEAAPAADPPAGGADPGSWERGGGEPWFLDPGPSATPLDAARLDAVFDGDTMVRVAPDRLPAALTHAPTRELLVGVGLPRHWAAGVTAFALGYDEAGPEADREGQGAGPVHLGAFEQGFASSVRVLVRPDTGEVLACLGEGAPLPLARDVETFLRLLEAVRRYMGACWDPYPGEDGIGDFLREVELLSPGSPEHEVWGQVFSAVTVLGVYGY